MLVKNAGTPPFPAEPLCDVCDMRATMGIQRVPLVLRVTHVVLNQLREDEYDSDTEYQA